MMRPTVAAALTLLSGSLSAQPAVADLSTTPTLVGNWTYSATGDGSEATFSDAFAHPQLWFHCTRATRRVTIAKPAAVASAALNIWTSDGARTFAATYKATTARLAAELGAYDSFLDSVSTSRGRFGVSIAGQPAAVLPPWPEVARVVEDCRV